MNSTRNVYLRMQTLKQARQTLSEQFPGFGIMPGETVSVADAVGRVLAEPVAAKISSPNFHSAAMDGIAVKAEDTFGASETRPKQLIIGKNAFYINTGHIMPENTDAVIMIENVFMTDKNSAQIEAPAFPWQYVRKMGEDIVATELLFPRNHKITPYCIGALLSGGIFSVPVRKKPKLLIIPTGSELADWQKTRIETLDLGKVIESNSTVLGKLAEACGASYVRHEILKDDLEKITSAVREAVKQDYDMVLTIGGSSAGSEDYSKNVVLELGEVLVHGVTMMPGKPLLIGKVNHKPVFGIPGYPVSAILAFEQFVRPLICRMLGQPEPEITEIKVEPGRKIASKLGVEEFVRVKLGKVGDRIVATQLPRGAGCITSITEADGIIRIPNESEGIRDGEQVMAELLKPLSSLNNTLVVIGSHDNTLDVLADELRARKDSLILSSSHVGSMGGLMAIRKGVCHLAGSHLLDTEDGSYNVSYIRKYLPDTPVKLIHLVYRDQGLIVLPNNPKHIRSIEDLARDDVRFINRQGGSGTRILLDFRLKEVGIAPSAIRGYETEEFTHMSVAVAVLSGAADVGLGIYAAAKALNLGFIPVVTEQYDLIIPQAYFDSPNIRILLETINSANFRQRVESLGGYSTRRTGEVI